MNSSKRKFFKGDELIEELIITALRIGSDDVCEADLKLFNRTLKEMQATSHVFQPYSREHKVAVYGALSLK